MFGVFLLNETIKHHIDSYNEVDQQFVENFERSIYVDDMVLVMEKVHFNFTGRQNVG